MTDNPNSKDDNSGSTKTLINLNNSREAARLDKGEIIQQEALRQFEGLIKQIKKRIPKFIKQLKCDDPIRSIRTHDVITVDGRRGSGKTTFILSAFKSLDKEIKDEICFLDIIDPTLIETREHVFVTIVSLIKRKVDSAYNKCDSSDCDNNFKSWRASLKNLANGMRLLDGIGQDHLKSDSWMDEHFALEHGIQNAQSGRDLEQSFHKYIHESLKCLGHEAFIIAFDDIDTDFSKGWPVLEMIRKYLTTPELITVLSGDLQLYSTLVEKRQWKNLGLGFDTDKDKQEQFKPMIEELVDQYLLKILRTPNRIELKSVGHYVDSKPYEIKVIRSGETEEQDLKSVLHNICTEIMCMRQESLANMTFKLLIELPTKTIVSLLFSIEDYTDLTWKVLGSANETDSNYQQTVLENRQSAILALSDVFLTWLQKIDYRRQDFEQTDPHKIITTLLKNTIKHDLMPEAASLKPIFAEQTQNSSIISLGALLSNSMAENPKSYFDYMLRAALSADTMREIPTGEFSTFTKHLGLLNEVSTLEISRKYISYMWPTSFSKAKSRIALQNGTLQIHSDSAQSSGELKKYHVGIPRLICYLSSKRKKQKDQHG